MLQPARSDFTSPESVMSFIFVAIHNYDSDITTGVSSCLAVELLHFRLELPC